MLSQTMQTRHFTKVSDLNAFMGLPAPEHPLFSVTSFDTATDRISCFDTPTLISTDFYTIALKHILSGEIQYGRTKYDFDNGTLIFTAPRQTMLLQGVTMEATGTSITIHEDYFRGHEIRERIKKYSFFSYAVNEALHLSPKEEHAIGAILANIELEYENNQDEFSKEIILAQLDTLLKYANRFYKRQFLHRQEMSGAIVAQFDVAIASYFESGTFEVLGTPRVEDIADRLGLSPRYLSDSLKAETGHTAMEHIHLYLIDEAKNLLLTPKVTVSETAYKLGFDSPQYFSRLFKKKVGVSPSSYRQQFLLN